MKKTIIYSTAVLIAAVAVFASWYFIRDGGESRNIEVENQNLKIDSGNLEKKKNIESGNIPKDAIMVVVRSPKANQTIESPLKIEGEARGSWYFEADFPIRLEDEKGKVLAQGVATAQSDWMTTDFVPFELTLTFDPDSASEGILIFEKNNPSGLSENVDSYRLPVFFTNGTHTKVKVFFGNSLLDKNPDDCRDVYPVEREVEKIPKIGQAALEELLKGPTEEEKERGYFTSIDDETELRGLSIQHGVAFVDFNDELDDDVDDKCEAQAIRSQIEQTLKQFPTVNEVQIYIGERSKDVLQPQES